MAGHDLDYFLDPAHADAFGTLSDDEKARLFAGESIGGEGGPAEVIADAAQSGDPATDEVSPAAQDAGQGGAAGEDHVSAAVENDPVIPDQELLAARESARQLAQQVREQGEELARLRELAAAPRAVVAPEAAATPEVAPETVDIDALERAAGEAWIEGDADKAVDLRRRINTEIMRRAEENARSAIEQQTRQAAEASLFASAVSKSIESYPFLDVDSDAANQEAIREVVEFRDVYAAQGLPLHEALARAVARIAPLYVTPPVAEAPVAAQPAPAVDVAAKAAEAIAKVKPRVPTSLSEVPAGSAAPHDEVAAIRDLSGPSLLARFSGKTPDQIMELMSRVI